VQRGVAAASLEVRFDIAEGDLLLVLDAVVEVLLCLSRFDHAPGGIEISLNIRQIGRNIR
jgi:hypothetical protein